MLTTQTFEIYDGAFKIVKEAENVLIHFDGLIINAIYINVLAKSTLENISGQRGRMPEVSKVPSNYV